MLVDKKEEEKEWGVVVVQVQSAKRKCTGKKVKERVIKSAQKRKCVGDDEVNVI